MKITGDDNEGKLEVDNFINPEEIGNTGIMHLQQDASSQGINDNEIIIVEDSKATSEIMVQKLEKITKSIHVYPNGDQLLRKLKLFPDMLKLTKIIILEILSYLAFVSFCRIWVGGWKGKRAKGT